MNLINSKVIQTELEQEIFIDQDSNFKLSHFHSPDKNFPFYEVMVSIDMMRIRRNEYYGTKMEVFGIRMAEDLQSIFILEPETQNIFALKNESERQAVIELIDYLLTKSVNFKQFIRTAVENLKKANIVCAKEIDETKAKLEVLERLLNIRSEDIKYPTQKRITA